MLVIKAVRIGSQDYKQQCRPDEGISTAAAALCADLSTLVRAQVPASGLLTMTASSMCLSHQGAHVCLLHDQVQFLGLTPRSAEWAARRRRMTRTPGRRPPRRPGVPSPSLPCAGAATAGRPGSPPCPPRSAPCAREAVDLSDPFSSSDIWRHSQRSFVHEASVCCPRPFMSHKVVGTAATDPPVRAALSLAGAGSPQGLEALQARHMRERAEEGRGREAEQARPQQRRPRQAHVDEPVDAHACASKAD